MSHDTSSLQKKATGWRLALLFLLLLTVGTTGGAAIYDYHTYGVVLLGLVLFLVGDGLCLMTAHALNEKYGRVSKLLLLLMPLLWVGFVILLTDLNPDVYGSILGSSALFFLLGGLCISEIVRLENGNKVPTSSHESLGPSPDQQ